MTKPVIFFDWDGTLADSMDHMRGEIRATLTRMGLPMVSDATMLRCNGPTFLECVPVLGIPPERVEEYLRIRTEAGLALVPQLQRLFPCVRELLEELPGRYRLVIASNGPRGYLERSIAQFQLTPLFTRVEAARPGRTKAQALSELLRELAPERAVMVGDRLTDTLAARANRLPSIAVQYGYGSPEEWRQADYAVADTEALRETLLMLLG